MIICPDICVLLPCWWPKQSKQSKFHGTYGAWFDQESLGFGHLYVLFLCGKNDDFECLKTCCGYTCLSPMGFQKPDIFWLSRGSRYAGAILCDDGKKTTRTGTSARVDQSSQKELAFWCCFTCLFRISEVATLSLSGCTLWFGICPEMGDLERESFICKMMRNHWIFWDTLTFRPNQVLYTPEIDDSSQMYHGDVSSECSPMHPTTHQCCTRQVEQGEIPAVPWLPVPLDPQKMFMSSPKIRQSEWCVCLCLYIL